MNLALNDTTEPTKTDWFGGRRLVRVTATGNGIKALCVNAVAQ